MAIGKIAAVVVTYDRPAELRQVVSALLGQTRRPDCIIVFDNGGPVRAGETLKEYEASLEIVHSDQNLGGSGGFAQGLALGLEREADWVWLLDDDAVPAPEALASLLHASPAQASDCGALCCGVREFGDWALRHRRSFDHRTGREHSLPSSVYQQDCVEIATGSFVGFLVAAEAARSVGLPDAEFFLSYDDTEYSLRLRDAGWRLWLVPGSVVSHLRHRASRLHTSRFGIKHYYNIRNRLIVKRRYARWRVLATVDGVAYALLLWLLAGGWHDLTGWQWLGRAMADGVAGQLGTGRVAER